MLRSSRRFRSPTSLDVLTLGQLFVVGFLVGTFTVFFDVAYQSYLPSLVERDADHRRQLEARDQPLGGADRRAGLGGILVQVVHRPVRHPHRRRQLPRPRASSSSESARREPRPEVVTVDGEKTSLWYELKEGLRFVLGNPNLRAQAGCTATSNFFSSVAFSIILVFLIRELGLSAGVIGLVLSIGAVGSLIAALTATRISNRFGIGPTTIAVATLFGPDDAADRLRPHRKRRGALPRRGDARVRVHGRRLQHRPGLIPASDLPAAAAGADELGDALHRVGNDPDRESPGRRACDADRPEGDHRRRRRRGQRRPSCGSCSRRSAISARCPSRSTTTRGRARSPPKRYRQLHAGAARGRGLGARARPARLTLADREGRARSHRDAEDRRAAALASSTVGASRARDGAGRTFSSRSRTQISSSACI